MATCLLAGDWLQSDYPGVLEGAVRSGLKSAAQLRASAQQAFVE